MLVVEPTTAGAGFCIGHDRPLRTPQLPGDARGFDLVSELGTGRATQTQRLVWRLPHRAMADADLSRPPEGARAVDFFRDLIRGSP